ncbi:MupA/Atu3671 family FMN-dependent luciferase-like monooxygenase [Actinocrispum wychmicini]|uniref:Natural product biosynthesis luciferase-like monooxygenase protein n=1 Tax=Actinocrispum wychmicini TaxID=1213861 RepID=A0A4R2JL89_9PSEU|nr:MupA/Atu3671 family FMN-dependent luciferase-like monooxygenase [Actinocrispum wychmicini]TCO59342.1 natural product biosynthesis luciferase-like monooxygenase protein [Actinocrispum wychmicini]
MNEQQDEPKSQGGDSGKAARAVGLYFFSALEEESDDAAAYGLLLDAARTADRNGLDFVWIPERHFTRFGGGHPNPAVLAAAIAVVTRNLRIRAGSVVLPLHDPLRVAEEWAVVDNLSNGRAEISAATGWNPRDFVLAPEDYERRAVRAAENLRAVRQLWSGGEISREGPDGAEYRVRTYPRPVQPVLPHWITASGNPATFEYAGETGAGLLTSYGLFGPHELAERIGLYRRTFAAHHGGRGRVCLMVHAAIGDSGPEIRRRAQEPLRHYLAAYLDQQGSVTDPAVAAKRLDFAVHRYLRGRSLIGDRAEADQVLTGLFEAGADEVACLVDFGLPRGPVLDTVAELANLRVKISG